MVDNPSRTESFAEKKKRLEEQKRKNQFAKHKITCAKNRKNRKRKK